LAPTLEALLSLPEAFASTEVLLLLALLFQRQRHAWALAST
jgi:hypothetical protein